MRKEWKLLVMAICTAFLLIAAVPAVAKAQGVKASEAPSQITAKADVTAAVARPSKADFNVYYYSPYTKNAQFIFRCPAGATSVNLEVYKKGKKIINWYFNDMTPGQVKYGYDYVNISFNTAYKYRIRGVGSAGAGAWSEFRYIGVPKAKLSSRSNKKGFTIKTPKVKAFKRYVVRVAKSREGSYKKVKTIKANKKRTTRIKKKYKKRARNYVRVDSYVKAGKKSFKSDISVIYYIDVFK